MGFVAGGSAYYLGLVLPLGPTPANPFRLAKLDFATGEETIYPLDGRSGNPGLYSAGDTLLVTEDGKLVTSSKLLTFLPVQGEFGAEIPMKGGIDLEDDVVYLKQAGVFLVSLDGSLWQVTDGALKAAEDAAGPWKIGRRLQQAFAVEGNGGERILALSAPVLPMNGMPATDDCTVLMLNPETRAIESEQPLHVRADASAVVSDEGARLRIVDAKAGEIVSVDLHSGKEIGRSKIAGVLTEKQRGKIRLIAEALPQP